MQCRICGNAEGNTPYRAKEMMLGLRHEFCYFQCRACRCLQIETIPPNLADYYPENYNGYTPPRTSVFGGPAGGFRRLRYAAALRPGGPLNGLINAVAPAGQYSLLGRFGLTPDSRVLDVGCGNGSYLYPLYELGFRKAAGIDPFIRQTLVYPNGYTVRKQYFEDERQPWDLILYNHSFEHVPNPQEHLRKVRQVLTDDGACVIRIPTVSSFAWEHYRTDWFQFDAPRHLFLHSVESMRLLAGEAGLQLMEVVYDSNEMQFIGSEMYRKDIPLVEKKKRRAGYANYLNYKLNKGVFQRKARTLNAESRGDQAAFILRKGQ